MLGFAMEINGAAMEFATIAGHAFEVADGEAGAVCRKENVRFRCGEFHCCAEEVFEVLLDLPAAALVSTGEGGWIEDDSVEFLPAMAQSRQDIEDIVGDESVARGGVELVESEVFAPAVEGFLRQVHADGFRTGECSGDAERAGIGKGV